MAADAEPARLACGAAFDAAIGRADLLLATHAALRELTATGTVDEED